MTAAQDRKTVAARLVIDQFTEISESISMFVLVSNQFVIG